MPMPLNVDSLREALDAGASYRFRTFWGHRPRPDGALSDSCLSQWWPCRFTLNGQRYSSAEQFMMASKARLFGDSETCAAILSTDDPARMKALGRKVRGYDEARWTAVRFDAVSVGNVAKFGQDELLKHYLLSTGEDVLVEASPTDRVWGVGWAPKDSRARDPRQWQGLNLLGFALMRARDVLRGGIDLPSLPEALR
jgi:ribA/ribD-fused uncharacterized protein